MDAALARPHAVPDRSGNGLAITLAVAMHALLAVLLFFGVRWQSSTPAVVQAELWSATPQTAAPRPQAVPPPVKAEAVTPATPPPTTQPEPPPPKADIVEKAPVKVAPKPPEPKPAPPKVQPAPTPPAAKVEPPKPKPVPKEAPRAPSDLAALMAQAEGPGPATSTGRDQQTSGPRGNAGYIARLVTAIRSQMRYPGSASGNPSVGLRIEQLPTGEVVNVTIEKPSGVPAFDEAVERAVRAASPLPRDTDGHVERVLTPTYYMYEKN